MSPWQPGVTSFKSYIDSQHRPVVILCTKWYILMLAYSLYLTRKNYCLSLTWSIECRFVFPLSLSLSLDSGEKSSDCLSAFHNPAMHFRFTDSSSIYIRNHSVQEDEENCMPTIPIPIAAAFLYILYRCCNIFWGSNYRTRYCFFAFAYVCILFAFCLHSVCILFASFYICLPHPSSKRLQKNILMQPRLSIRLITMAQLCP